MPEKANSARRRTADDEAEDEEDAFDDAASYNSAEELAEEADQDQKGNSAEDQPEAADQDQKHESAVAHVQLRFGEVAAVDAPPLKTPREEHFIGEDNEYFIGDDKSQGNSADSCLSPKDVDSSPKSKKAEPEDKNVKVPRDNRYFLHDDRGGEANGAQTLEEGAEKSGKGGKKWTAKDSSNEPKTADSDGPWGHDKYMELYGNGSDGAKAKIPAPKQKRWKEEGWSGQDEWNKSTVSRGNQGWGGNDGWGKDDKDWASNSGSQYDKKNWNDSSWSQSDTRYKERWGKDDHDQRWGGGGYGQDWNAQRRHGNKGPSRGGDRYDDYDDHYDKQQPPGFAAKPNKQG